MPELPAAKRARFIEVYDSRDDVAQKLTSMRATAEYYEIVAEVSTDPKTAANWVTEDFAGYSRVEQDGRLRASGKHMESRVPAQNPPTLSA